MIWKKYILSSKALSIIDINRINSWRVIKFLPSPMTIAWRIEDLPDPFTPVIKFTRAFGWISKNPWVMKFSKVILQIFPSLYWVWKRFVVESNWGRYRGELVFDDVRTGVLWFDEFFARFFGVVAEIFSLLGLFLEDILFAHADKVSEHWTYAMRRHHWNAQTATGQAQATDLLWKPDRRIPKKYHATFISN